MKKLIQLLTPSFVKQLDKLLLEKYPFLWSKRLVHVLFFGLLILTFNLLLSSFTSISVFSYSSIWIITWMSSLPAILFVLIWIFFQYKYDLAWDHSKMGWAYYFKTGLSYTLICIYSLAMVVIPVGIYQHRINTYYDNSISIPVTKEDDTSRSVGDTYFYNYYTEDTDVSFLGLDNKSLTSHQRDILYNVFNELNFSGHHNLDTIIMTGVEEYLEPNSFLGLKQQGDSLDPYPDQHLWLVNLEEVKKTVNGKTFMDGTVSMFSPQKYFQLNKEKVLNDFDTSDYSSSSFFNSRYLSGSSFPDPVPGRSYDWKSIIQDPAYHIESQKIRIYDKQSVEVVHDHRLGKSYHKYRFVTELPEQNISLDTYLIGATVRGKAKLFAASEFYNLKRLEHFLFERFNIESLEQVTPKLLADNITAYDDLGSTINNLEADYGEEVINYQDEDTYMGILSIIYISSTVLALLILTVRLLNFRFLVMSLIALALLSFIVFVPLVGFRINSYSDIPFLFLSCIFGALIGAVIRLNLAKSVSRFMIVSALSGLIALPLITLFYFIFIVTEVMFFEHYREENQFLLQWGLVLSAIFILGHIPLIARTIHKAYYLPKR